MRVKYEDLKDTIKKALIANGVAENQAEEMAKIHSDSSLRGVNSHGLNRIPRLIEFINKGLINMNGDLELKNSFGSIENYDANLGFGSLNSVKAANRVVELAEKNGIGLVSLKNSTHWMRAGTYGEIIAEKGMIGILWTNTESLMPLWGSSEKSVGNNPVCIAISSDTGDIILDMAMSQYSYGKLDTYIKKGELLPYPGGFDKDGNLTSNPKDILDSSRLIPVGYWKGSGLSFCLDVVASLLSTGKSTFDLDDDNAFNCTGCSQIFLAINPGIFSTEEENNELLNKIKDRLHSVYSIDPKSKVRYPGEGLDQRQKSNLEKGIEVDDDYYNKVKSYIDN